MHSQVLVHRRLKYPRIHNILCQRAIPDDSNLRLATLALQTSRGIISENLLEMVIGKAVFALLQQLAHVLGLDFGVGVG
jgi:hypothetical protein